ncbi:MAG: VWD domain-containing protein [Candidatus Dormiibacterota bacterium]
MAGVTIVALLAAVVTVVLVTRHSSTSATTGASHSPGPASNGGITSEDQLIQAIATQGWTPLRAEQLFALDVGPLPGVSVQGITPAGGFDASMAVTGLYGQWDHLTAAQRTAATAYLTPSHTQSHVSIGPADHSAGAVLLGNTNYNYQALADAANHDEALYTHTSTVEITVEPTDQLPKNPDTYAETWLWVRNGTGPWTPLPTGCKMQVYTPRFAGLDAVSAAAIIAHEVFHCFLYRQEGSGANWETVGAWINEGEPDWVMDELDPGAFVEQKAWNLYTNTPGTPYSQRDYDGVGVFGHQGDMAGDQTTVWDQLLPVTSADIGHHDQAALTLLMGGSSDHYYSAWGSSYYEDASHSDWRMKGPSQPPTTGPAPDSQHINDGDIKDIAADAAYKAHPITIDGSAEILVIVLASGYGQAHDQDFGMEKTLTNTAPLALCQKSGGCKCPDGTAGASEFTIPSQGPVSLGLDGGDTGIASYAAGMSLDKFCTNPDPGPPPPGPPPNTGGGGGGGGGDDQQPKPGGTSEGDPHLLTFDNQPFDLQSAGEFTLSKSTVDDFNVQVRQVPLPGKYPVAVNAAVAAKVSGHRVTFQLENSVLVARVDGVPDNLGGVMNVGTGTLERLGTDAGVGFLLEWPDGSMLEVGELGVVGIDITLKPAATRAGTLTGLFGNDNGQPGDDLTTSGGVTLTSPSAQTVHQQFANSWRITQAQSLFDYKPGQTTATFTNRAFPSSYVNGSNIPGAAAATQECQADGVTDQYLLADCVVDVTAVKSPAVVVHYAHAQVVKTVQFNLAHHLPPFTAPSGSGGGPTPTPGTATPTPNLQGVTIDSGRVSSPAQEQVFTFTANAGDILWFGQPACDDGQMVFAVIDPSGQTLNADQVSLGLDGCQIGRIAATTSGTYQLVANADKARTGSYGVPIRFERHDVVSQTSYGQTLSGSIPDTATHDVYQFTAQVGDSLHIFGSGCNIGPANSIVGLADSTGKPVGPALDCTPNSGYVIQTAGTYELIVNFSNVGPFTYQFVIQK